MLFNLRNSFRVFKFLLITLLFNFLIGCNFSEDNPGKIKENKSGRIYHPTKENIPTKGLSSTASFQPDEKELSSYGTEILNKLTNYEELARFSDGDNEFNNPFPPVDDVVIDNQGYFLVLANKLRRILVYDNNGEFVTTIGRGGRGPGEFMDPKAIDLDQNGNLYVLDKFEVDIFSLQDGISKSKRPIEHGLYRSIDLCLLNEKVIISGFSVTEHDQSSSAEFPLSVSKPLHSYNKNGEEIQSFGKKYKSSTGWPIFTGQLSEMYLTCHDSTETVMTTYVTFPFIHGYSKKGNLKWVSKINGFSYINQYEKSNPAPQFGIESSEKPVNVIENLTDIGDGYALLQIGSDVESSNSTFLINSKSGKTEYLTNELNNILSSSEKYYMLKKINDSLLNDYKIILKIIENNRN